jgi:hypothetical protein
MSSNNASTPPSPVLRAFLAFDSTTGLLAAGSWGATLTVTIPDQSFQLTAVGSGAPGDTFTETSVPTVVGAGFLRQIIETPPGGGSNFLFVVDAAGAAALLPANTRVFVRVWARNGAIS